MAALVLPVGTSRRTRRGRRDHARCGAAGDSPARAAAPRRLPSGTSRSRWWRSSAYGPTSANPPWSTGFSAAARRWCRTQPGVTRDRVAYDAIWRGRAFTLVDTGGWEPFLGSEAGQASRALAEQVTAQARLAVETADAVLFVVDVTVGITDSDDAVAAVLRRSGKPVVVAANKVDDAPGELDRVGAVGARARRAVAGERAARPGSGDLLDALLAALPQAPAEPAPAPGPAPGGARRPPQRGEVQPAQQAGGRGPGPGGRGGGHHP